MTAVNAEPSPDWCACVVVSVGRDAQVALRDVARDTPRFWYAIAVGRDAALAQADRTIAIDDRPDLESLLPRLEHAWTGIEFVYVVVDQRDDDARRLACAILDAAQDVNRTRVAVLLGRTWSCHREPVRDVCDAILRLADDRASESVADALYAVLSPFMSLWAPIPLDEHATLVREASDARVLARRSSGRALQAEFASLLDETVGSPHFIHLLHGDQAVTMGGAQRALYSDRVADAQFSGGIGDALGSEEVLFAIVAPRGEPMRAREGRKLRSTVADRASALLPHGAPATTYRQRLQQELAWWTAIDERADAILQLALVAQRLDQSGGTAGPTLRNAGGSLVTYVLGLTAFDPVEWDLSFEEFVNGRHKVVLDLSISPETRAMVAEPLDIPRAASASFAFTTDERLRRTDATARRPDWRMALRSSRATVHRVASEAASALAASGLEPDAVALPGFEELTQISQGWLIYDDQLTTVLSRVLGASYPVADRVRCSLAKGGVSADEAVARWLRGPRCGAGGIRMDVLVDRLRRRALTSLPRSETLTHALIETLYARIRDRS